MSPARGGAAKGVGESEQRQRAQGTLAKGVLHRVTERGNQVETKTPKQRNGGRGDERREVTKSPNPGSLRRGERAGQPRGTPIPKPRKLSLAASDPLPAKA